jgi:hypothetical protein
MHMVFLSLEGLQLGFDKLFHEFVKKEDVLGLIEFTPRVWTLRV